MKPRIAISIIIAVALLSIVVCVSFGSEQKHAAQLMVKKNQALVVIVVPVTHTLVWNCMTNSNAQTWPSIFIVQQSTMLPAQWTTLTNILFISGVTNYQCPVVDNGSNCFYRVAAQ